MEIELRDPASLTPHPRNSRRHSATQITALARAIETWGFTQPVVALPDGTILVGHARTQAAIAAGLRQIPVIVRAMSEPEARALVIADNRLHEFGAGWDADLLGDELRLLMAADFDVSLTGLDAPDPLPDKAREDDEDDLPDDAPAGPCSREGDVWTLGDHRLFVGDATDPAILARALAVAPSLMVTDPPYGVNYDPGWRNAVMRANGTMVTARATGKVMNDDRADWSEVWAAFVTAGGRAAYVWHAGTQAHVVEESLRTAGLTLRAQIVWAKDRHVIGRGHYHHQHEPCFFATAGKGQPKWRGPAASTIWRFGHRRSHTGHGTQKPVEAMRRPILAHSAPGDLVFDPFCGSGTTIIAAEATGRAARAIELNPEYADMAALRWALWTGGVPELLRDGRPVSTAALLPGDAA